MSLYSQESKQLCIGASKDTKRSCLKVSLSKKCLRNMLITLSVNDLRLEPLKMLAIDWQTITPGKVIMAEVIATKSTMLSDSLIGLSVVHLVGILFVVGILVGNWGNKVNVHYWVA